MKWLELRENIQALLKNPKSGFGKFDFNEALSLLIRERFMARAAHSSVKDSIILKGGLLLTMVYTKSARYTGDADIGLKNAHDLTDFQNAVDAILAVDLNDGFSYARNNGEILSNQKREYDGAQFNIECSIDSKPRLKFTLDIGVGDAVKPSKGKLPTLTEFEVSSLEMHVYPPETIAAEKFHAAVTFGARNTRFKDFYDLFVLREHVTAADFAKSATQTFKRRKTTFPGQLPAEKAVLDRMQKDWEVFLNSKQYKVIKKVPKNFRKILIAIEKHYLSNLKKNEKKS
jgi:hypothetical protein